MKHETLRRREEEEGTDSDLTTSCPLMMTTKHRMTHRRRRRCNISSAVAPAAWCILPIISIVIILAFLPWAADGATYCGQFMRDEATNITGYFAMNILSPGKAQYWYRVDLRGVSRATLGCDLSKGLTVRVASNWTSKTRDSGLGTMPCGPGVLGAAYDPYFGCRVGSASPACVLLKRTAPDLYTYTCNPATYSQGLYSACDVGDISGKFGLAKPSLVPSPPGALVPINTFESNGVLTDYAPPIEAQYLQQSVYGNMWASVLFSCAADGSPVTCAKLKLVPPNAPSLCNFPPTVAPLSAPNALRPLTGQETALCVIGVAFFFYAVATVYLFLSLRCFPRKPVMSEMDEDTRIQMHDIYPTITPLEPVDVVYDRTPIDSRRPGRITGTRLGDLAMAKSLRQEGGTKAEQAQMLGGKKAAMGDDSKVPSFSYPYSGGDDDDDDNYESSTVAATEKKRGTHAYWNNENVA